jgi:hypothetical protein
VFIRQVLEIKGSSNWWCQWIESIIQGGYMEIKINDQVVKFFKAKKARANVIIYLHCYLILW